MKRRTMKSPGLRAWEPALLAVGLCLCLLLLFPAPPLSAQSDPDASLDELFDEPEEDIAADQDAEDLEIDHTQAYVAPQSLTLSGSFSSEGGIGLGWKDWPDLSSPLKNYDGTMGAQASSSLSMNARASENLQVTGSVSVSMNPLGGAYTWSGISVGQIYADYYGIPNVFVRLGQHSFGWGQGRLFTPGNLMGDSGSGAALRVLHQLARATGGVPREAA